MRAFLCFRPVYFFRSPAVRNFELGGEGLTVSAAAENTIVHSEEIAGHAGLYPQALTSQFGAACNGYIL
jgi:hypothetical protein